MRSILGLMGRKRSGLEYKNLKIYVEVFLGFVLFYASQVSLGVTNPNDVAAINSLHAALGSPAIPGWVSSGGDPCGEAWQGVQCNGSDIIKIVLNAANLGGELGDNLGSFSSIRAIDLSNNHIGGSIPSNLPVSMQNFFLSANQFTGSIPPSLSYLTQLTDMSLNDNLLTGEIPDSFISISGLINLDLSNNKLSGKLPPTLENLMALTTLHLQNNKLSGTLDVLQDLPLKDLNVEFNQFNGPIPPKLFNIPNFRKDGNLFNISSTAPVPAPRSLITPPSGPVVPEPPPSGHTPPSGRTPPQPADGPSSLKELNSGKSNKFLTTKKVAWISIAGVLLFIILILGLALFAPRCTRRRREVERISKPHQIGADEGDRQNSTYGGPMVEQSNQTEKGALARQEDHQAKTRRMGAIPKPQDEQARNLQKTDTSPKQEDHRIDMSSLYYLDPLPPVPPPPPPPPPPPLPPVERVIVQPIAHPGTSVGAKPPTIKATPVERVTVQPIVHPGTSVGAKPSTKKATPLTSAKSFTIASLQQYTNSFSQDNLIGGGMLGNVYRAQLPDGKLLAVKKLDKRTADKQSIDEFLELVDNIDKIRHANVVELIGYCAEHGQRLLIYEYCSHGTLQDALHSDDESRNLSWNTRIRIALGAARALEYLHELCHPPIVHRNFKSVNVLLDEDLSARVSDCGLAPLIASGSVNQLSGHLLSAYGYGAPEFESGNYTLKSDVYSFGVVMLELLTGRKSHDRTRNRGEQFLVRWAIPQLHDIDALSRMVDPSLEGKYPAKSLSNFADIISRCVQSEPEFRPLMSVVVQDLLDMIRRERHGSGSSDD